jgi:hypothetical protein
MPNSVRLEGSEMATRAANALSSPRAPITARSPKMFGLRLVTVTVSKGRSTGSTKLPSGSLVHPAVSMAETSCAGVVLKLTPPPSRRPHPRPWSGCSLWWWPAQQVPGRSGRPRPPEHPPRRTRGQSHAPSPARANDDSGLARQVTHLSYSSWRRHQTPVSLRPLGARSSHGYMPQRPSSPRAYVE